MKTVTVTIGRNVGDKPLPQDVWNQFVWAITRAFDTITTEQWANGSTKGIWQGVTEEARVLYGPVRQDATDLDLRRFRARLATLATQYGQDAIGLSVGESELVESFGIPENMVPEYVS